MRPLNGIYNKDFIKFWKTATLMVYFNKENLTVYKSSEITIEIFGECDVEVWSEWLFFFLLLIIQ